ncbi:MAG: sulfotransferase domain-containing protein [Alphaproteobacteria bacterium]|nr:sulfotransferase domain-containing protein [Alphaproteobacteria bacterium]
MVQSLVLHIGANKTGSSAVQEFLRLNAKALARQGLTVAPSDLLPDSPITGQHLPFLEHLRQDIPQGRTTVSERIDALMEALPQHASLLISAENLSNLNGTHELFADATARHPATVILYIRRQDELLLSSWQQWGGKTSTDFWAWISQAAGHRGNWRLTLEPWEQLVGRERIRVRVYDRKRLYRQDVIADFMKVLGAEGSLDEMRMPEQRANPSYAESVADLLKGNPLLFDSMHDNKPYELVEELTGNHFHRDPRESIITHEQRLALLAKYAAANAWVKNRYFSGLGGPLFTPPARTDYRFLDRKDLERQKWQVVAALLAGLSKKILNPS